MILIAASLALVTTIGWFMVGGRTAGIPERPMPQASSAAPNAGLARAALMVAGPGPAPTAPVASGSVESPAEPAKSLAHDLERRLATGHPEDAMEAYKTVDHCLLSRRMERAPLERYEGVPVPAPSRAACGDIRPDQVVSRVQWLVKAAEAGLQGAALQFLQEGPSGNGLEHDLAAPADPTIASREWLDQRDRYIDLGLHGCDVTLAVILGAFAQGVPADQDKARAYWMTRLSCPQTGNPDLPSLADDAEGQRLLKGAPTGWGGPRTN